MDNAMQESIYQKLKKKKKGKKKDHHINDTH